VSKFLRNLNESTNTNIINRLFIFQASFYTLLYCISKEPLSLELEPIHNPQQRQQRQRNPLLVEIPIAPVQIPSHSRKVRKTRYTPSLILPNYNLSRYTPTIRRSDIQSYSRAGLLFLSDHRNSYSPLDPSRSFNKQIKYGEHMTNIDSGRLGQDACHICLDDYDESSKILVFPCGHYCHLECYQEYRNISLKTQDVLGDRIRKTDQGCNAAGHCLLCQLCFLGHYIYFKDYGYDPEKVIFDNKN